MNTTTETMQHRATRESGLKWAASGSAMEAIAALATMALAIVGLAGVFSTTLAAIATIIVGAAILIEGGSFSAGAFAARGYAADVGAGLSAQALGGIAGIVLGILALLGVAQPTLLSVAVLVYGAAFLLSRMEFAQTFAASGSVELPWREAGSGQVLIGVAGVVLGILAVIGISSLTLVLVALLSFGAAALFSGSALGAKSVAALNR
jgi:hypothetical protein